MYLQVFILYILRIITDSMELSDEDDAEDQCEEKEAPYAKKIQTILNRKEATSVPSTSKVGAQQKKEVSIWLFTIGFAVCAKAFRIMDTCWAVWIPKSVDTHAS